MTLAFVLVLVSLTALLLMYAARGKTSAIGDLDDLAGRTRPVDIEAFRNLNQEIETIINKSEAVKKARKDANDEELSAKKRKELSDAEKDYKSRRKQIQEKLIAFDTSDPYHLPS